MKVDRFQQATCLVLSQLVRRSAFEQPNTNSGKPRMALCPNSRDQRAGGADAAGRMTTQCLGMSTMGGRCQLW